MKRRQRKALADVNLLEQMPVRVAEWEEADGRVVIIRPLPKTRGFRGLVDRLLFEMSTRRIRLDEVASAVWKLLDGHRTVGAIATALPDQYGDAVEPVNERVGTLVQVLHRELFIEFRGIDDTGR